MNLLFPLFAIYNYIFCRKVDSTLKQDCDRFFVDAAIHSNPDPSKIDVVAVGRNGVVYSFHNISLCDGTLDSTHDQNMSVDIDVGSIRGTRIKCLTDKENPQVPMSIYTEF